jgi:hypothetical protein
VVQILYILLYWAAVPGAGQEWQVLHQQQPEVEVVVVQLSAV